MKKCKVQIPEEYEFVTHEVKADGDELRVSKIYRKKEKELPKTWEEFLSIENKCRPSISNLIVPPKYSEALSI